MDGTRLDVQVQLRRLEIHALAALTSMNSVMFRGGVLSFALSTSPLAPITSSSSVAGATVGLNAVRAEAAVERDAAATPPVVA